MLNSFDISGALAVDTRSVDTLRLQARKDPEQALKGAARQFEALFMNMLLKSMREATPKDGLFNSDQTRFYTSLLDQQLAQSLSLKGIGLADLMARQLSRFTAVGVPPSAAGAATASPAPQSGVLVPEARHEPMVDEGPLDSEYAPVQSSMPNSRVTQNVAGKNFGAADPMIRRAPRAGGASAPHPFAPAAARSARVAAAPRPGSIVPPQAGGPQDFVNRFSGHATAASQATGIPARFMLAQAALESGWGKHEIRLADGSPSFNLFGIKAGRNWRGQTVEKVTTEYVNGVAHKTVEKFRVYGSYAEGFRDYANLLLTTPRYAAVLQQRDAADFARGLQRAGYATDPVYAEKLMRIMSGNVLRQSVAAKV